MKNKIAFLFVMFLSAFILFSCSNKNPEQPVAGGKGTTTPFNTAVWLSDEQNSSRFEYIQLEVFKDTWDRETESIDSIVASDEDKSFILDKLKDIMFAPEVNDPSSFTNDFSFAMNEPFLFFGYTDDKLFVKVPWEGEGGYIYYSADFKSYPALEELKEFIGEIRLGYYQSVG